MPGFSSFTRRVALGLPLIGPLLAKTALAQTQPQAPDTEWRNYANDLSSNRYSPLDEINAQNFNDLEVAWRLKTDFLGDRPEYQYETTPLLIKGRLYTVAGSRRAVVALDAANGEMIWMHSENEGERGKLAPRQLSGRGVAYWTDGREERIIYVTPGYRMWALDARTGIPVPSFGDKGVVDLRLNDDQDMDPVHADIGLHSTPLVSGNTIVVGAAHLNGDIPHSYKNVKGYVRGFDARTGKRKWIFHTIPRKGEFGYDTWVVPGQAEATGNTGAWAEMSADPELGLLYIPVELPTGDFNGQYRKGPGLFGETLVAVDIETGKRRWHYQLVHHGLWDRDIPCAAILCDIPVNGKIVKALAQPSKQAYLYVLNRETGEPIWPIVETPVPKGDVPGEWYSPTQPIPSKPPGYDWQGVSPEVVINFTPELHTQALQLISHYNTGNLYMPPTLSTPPTETNPNAKLGTLTTPGTNGGTDWPGGAYDPETHTVYVFSQTQLFVLGVIPNSDTALSDFDYIRGMTGVRPRPVTPAGGVAQREAAPAARPAAAATPTAARPATPAVNTTTTVQGLPLLKPPYGRITAIDLTKGDISWQIAHGDTPDEIKNHPALRGLNIPRTGRAGLLGPLVTKTLVICGESGFVTTASGARGAMLRAYDKATGEDRGAVYMPAPQTGAPMTYRLNGEQYIVLAIGGGNFSAELIAFRLPRT
jgi:quinoprotein glucose dehydrogenase